MVNKDSFVEILEEMAQLMRILEENEFRVRALERGAQAIGETSENLEQVAAGKVKIPGVGDGLRGYLSDFLNTGTVGELAKLRGEVPLGVIELMKIPGLGPKKAMTVHKELGINSIGELEYACRENRLTELKGFGASTQAKILKSIEQLNANKGKLRIDEALDRVDGIREALAKTYANLVPVGALLRKLEVVNSLEFYGTAKKTTKTKSEKFATHIQELAGMEIEVFTGTEPWEKLSEKEQAWLTVAPELRDSPKKWETHVGKWSPLQMEAENFSRKSFPKKPYAGEKMRGIFHCHTTASDGSDSLEKMIAGAQKLGYEYIGISDHSQSAFYARGLKSDAIRAQREEIEKLQKKFSIRIFHGVESDILADGALDYPKDVLSKFDFVIGSIHSRFQMNGKEMTERLTKAAANPYLTILGHPTGRLLLSRPAYEFDWPQVLDALAENGASIEINANPQRLDVDWRLGSELVSRKIPVSINPDAHSVDGLEDTQYGEWMAEKAMLDTAQILNLKSVDEMEKYLWSRKER